MPDSPKTIVLTGATRGLGRALVPELTQRGHTVIGCGRSPQAIADLSGLYPAPHHFSQVDVSDANAVAMWAKNILSHYPAPDLLINNAAVINTSAPLWEISPGEFSTLVDINIKGVTYVTQAYLSAMIKRGTGVVVNLSSGWGRSVDARVAPYCASKWAVEGLTRALAEELPAGLAAIPLNPGIIDTDMLRACLQEGASSYPAAEEWARQAAPFLLRLGPGDNGRPLTVPS